MTSGLTRGAGDRLRRRRRPCGLAAIFLFWLFGLAMPAHAGRPLVVDDADPVEKDRIQIEAGAELATTSSTKTADIPVTLTLGITRWMEVSVGSSALYLDDKAGSPRRAAGVGDVLLAAKARLPVIPFGLDLSVAPFVKLPTADEKRGLGSGELDGGATLIVTHAFTEDVRLHVNVGYTFVGRPRGQDLRDILFVGLAGETPIGIDEERLRAVAEVFGTSKPDKNGRSDIQGRLGVRYLLKSDLVLDLAVGRSVTSNPRVEVFATVGLTWTFDAPWKPKETK